MAVQAIAAGMGPPAANNWCALVAMAGEERNADRVTSSLVLHLWCHWSLANGYGKLRPWCPSSIWGQGNGTGGSFML